MSRIRIGSGSENLDPLIFEAHLHDLTPLDALMLLGSSIHAAM